LLVAQETLRRRRNRIRFFAASISFAV
jgi:hypothetical protein